MSKLSDLDIPPPKDWQCFERWACDLFAAEWQTNAKMHGRTGQPQHGVDIYGQPKGINEWYGVQCKKKDRLADSNITADELREEVEKAKKFTPTLTQFIIATTGQRDASIQQVARQISQENQSKGLFSICIMFWDDFLDMYDRHWGIFMQHYDHLLYHKYYYRDSDRIKDNLLNKVAEAEEHCKIKQRVEETIKEVKELLGRGMFDKAHRVIQALPREAKELKDNLLEQVVTTIDHRPKNGPKYRI